MSLWQDTHRVFKHKLSYWRNGHEMQKKIKKNFIQYYYSFSTDRKTQPSAANQTSFSCSWGIECNHKTTERIIVHLFKTGLITEGKESRKSRGSCSPGAPGGAAAWGRGDDENSLTLDILWQGDCPAKLKRLQQSRTRTSESQGSQRWNTSGFSREETRCKGQ